MSERQPPPPTPAPAATVDRLRAAFSALRSVERFLGTSLELNPTDVLAMEILAREGPTTPTALAGRLGITSAAATFVVDRLAASGHATREPHPTDRRKTVIVPAEASVARVGGLMRGMGVGIGGYVAALGDDDRATVDAFLDAVTAIYSEAAGVVPPAPAA